MQFLPRRQGKRALIAIAQNALPGALPTQMDPRLKHSKNYAPNDASNGARDRIFLLFFSTLS